MKILLLVIFVLAQATIVRAQSFEWYSYTKNNKTKYRFAVNPTKQTAKWDSSKSPPPTSAAKARALAIGFMKSVPAQEGQSWRLRELTLRQLTDSPETWCYIVNFTDEKEHLGAGSYFSGFNVIVTMDGKVPGQIDKSH